MPEIKSLKDQAYEALYLAAERMGINNYKDQVRVWKKTHKSMKNFRFYVTEEHKSVIDAMPKVLSGELTPEQGMALLHDYCVLKQRLG